MAAVKSGITNKEADTEASLSVEVELLDFIASKEQDSERLDWLEMHPTYELRFAEGEDGEFREELWTILRLRGGKLREISSGNSLREVIDAAASPSPRETQT